MASSVSSLQSVTDTSFTVRQAASRDDLQWILQEVRLAPRLVTSDDAEIFIASGLASSFFVGEKEGKKISAVAFFKLDSYVAVSYYFVVEAERGKGYGRRTWEYAWEASKASEYTSMLLSEHDTPVQRVFLRRGFRVVWKLCLCGAPVQELTATLSHLPVPDGITVQPGSTADFTALAAYDRRVCGVYRGSVIKNLMTFAPLSYVAVNARSSKIVGFIAIIKFGAGVDYEEYFANPFLAENTLVATALLKSAAPALADRERDSTNLQFCIPNRDCQQVMAFFTDVIKVNQTIPKHYTFMCSGDPPKVDHTQYYSSQLYFPP